VSECVTVVACHRVRMWLLLLVLLLVPDETA
jgi:hypothetical protein